MAAALRAESHVRHFRILPHCGGGGDPAAGETAVGPPLKLKPFKEFLREDFVGRCSGAVLIVVDDRLAKTGASARRVVRGMTVSNTRSPKCWRTSPTT